MFEAKKDLKFYIKFKIPFGFIQKYKMCNKSCSHFVYFCLNPKGILNFIIKFHQSVNL